MSVPCFWIEPTGKFVRFLRVFSTNDDCDGRGYCDARTFVAVVDPPDSVTRTWQPGDAEAATHAAEWPKACVRCGRPFHVKRSQRQLFHEREMRVVRAMPGAARAVGATCHLVVMLPNGREWAIDSRASNCTLPDDTTHHCWIRHGTPPNVTVDKRGKTCSAGAGSIQSGNYHGFLRGGALVE